jgi:hypothetical protein
LFDKITLQPITITNNFQPINDDDIIIEKKSYNRFTYESIKKLYDIEVYYDGSIKYYINMVESEKTKYHQNIELFFKDEIEKTTKSI